MYVCINSYVGLPASIHSNYRLSFVMQRNIEKQSFPTLIVNWFHTRFLFFNFYLPAPKSTLGHYRGDSLTHPMLITGFYWQFSTEDHREPRNQVGSQSPAKHLAGFELWTFRFWFLFNASQYSVTLVLLDWKPPG